MLKDKGISDYLQDLPRDDRRGIEIMALCRDCGRPLPVDVFYDGKRIISKTILFHHNRSGIWCPHCAPDAISKLEDDPDTPQRCPAEKEKKILNAMKKRPQGITATELNHLIGIPRMTIARRLDAMEKRGQIWKKEKSKYFLREMTQDRQDDDAIV